MFKENFLVNNQEKGEEKMKNTAEFRKARLEELSDIKYEEI